MKWHLSIKCYDNSRVVVGNSGAAQPATSEGGSSRDAIIYNIFDISKAYGKENDHSLIPHVVSTWPMLAVKLLLLCQVGYGTCLPSHKQCWRGLCLPEALWIWQMGFGSSDVCAWPESAWQCWAPLGAEALCKGELFPIGVWKTDNAGRGPI